jgi:hypothetical protein
MNTTLALVLTAGLLAVCPVHAEKSDLAREKYVEASDTDFILTVKLANENDRKTRQFELAAPTTGAFTLLSFVDGKFFKREKITLPGTYVLSVRGLAPGSHKVTIQTVDKDGRIGSVNRTITTEK